jgi:microcin C transport system permease protein
VVGLVLEKLPVSISLGLWTTALIYLISIPLGVAKAVRDGSAFDVWTSAAVIIGYAIPGFLFAILLVVLFAGGSVLDWFPLRGLVSADLRQLSWPMRIVDYLWHIALPVTALVIGGFTSDHADQSRSSRRSASSTSSPRAALSGRRVSPGHVFRNAMPWSPAFPPVHRSSSPARCSSRSLLPRRLGCSAGAAINRDTGDVRTLYIYTMSGPC